MLIALFRAKDVGSNHCLLILPCTYILYFIVIDFSQTKCSGGSFSPVCRVSVKLNESLENPVSYLRRRHDINSCVPNHIVPLVIFIALRLFRHE